MPGDDKLYHGADGNTSPLDTADAVDVAVSDLSQRLLAVETKPAPAAGTGDGDAEYRLKRLEAVLVEYFFSQFQRYDADNPKPADTSAATQGEKGTGEPAGT